jgi:predicted kinase
MRQPTLFLTVGLPSTGKTTAARRIEVEQEALRLTKDEWVKALYGLENPPSAQDVIEGRLIQVGLRALELGINVVIDYGLWSRDERSALRQAAADLGARVEVRYFELTAAEQRRRLDQRQAEAPTRLGPCLTRNSPSGLPTSTSQRQVNSTAVKLLMAHPLDSRHGRSGAGIAGRRRSPDAASSPRCHDRPSARSRRPISGRSALHRRRHDRTVRPPATRQSTDGTRRRSPLRM